LTGHGGFDSRRCHGAAQGKPAPRLEQGFTAEPARPVSMSPPLGKAPIAELHDEPDVRQWGFSLT